MKKRLLSAALAFAMVLTMIPATMVTAFAAEEAYNTSPVLPNTKVKNDKGEFYSDYRRDKDGNIDYTTYNTITVTYQTASDDKTGKEAGKWYWKDTYNDGIKDTDVYYYVNSGIVAGSSGNSGQWYPDFTAFCRGDVSLRGNNLTLLSDGVFDFNGTLALDKAPTSLTIDVNGKSLTLGALPSNFSSLTIKNRHDPRSHSGSVSGISKNTANRPYVSTTPRPSYSNLNLTISDTTVDDISILGGSNTVTLNNVNMTGKLTMSGYSETESSNGSITKAYASQKINVNVTDMGTVSTMTNITGGIEVTDADSSTLRLVNLNTGANDVALTGNGGSITVEGASTLGDITTTARLKTGTVPKVAIKGGSVGDILAVHNQSPKESEVTIESAGSAASVTTDNGKVTVNGGAVRGNVVVKSCTNGTSTNATGGVTLNGPVTIDGNVFLGEKGKVKLSISGNGSKIGGIQTTNDGTNWFGNNLTIDKWPTGRDNYFGHLSLVNYHGRGVTGGTFSNDTNTNVLTKSGYADWFSTDLQLAVNMQETNDKGAIWGLYGKTEMARAISDITSANAGNGNNGNTTPTNPGGNITTIDMHIIGHSGNKDALGNAITPNVLQLMNGGILWAQIQYDYAIGMILPERINGMDIATWVSGDNSASVPSGKEQVIPLPSSNGIFTLHANDIATSVVKSITGARAAAQPASPNGVQNKDVRVTLNGNKINITGAIVPAPGSSIATIELDLTTDALNTTAGTGDGGNADSGSTSGGGSSDTGDGTQRPTGYLVLKNVQVFYNVATKAVGFNNLQKIEGGAIVNEAGELVLNNGTGTHYTVSASLVQSASTLTVVRDRTHEVQVTVGGKLSSRTQTDKDNIINAILGTDANGENPDAEFVVNNNQAILEAINAAQATFTNDKTVENWVNTAQNYVWKNGNKYVNSKGQPDEKGKGSATHGANNDQYINPHTGNLSTTGAFADDAADIIAAYSNAYIVPYLVVNVTDLNQNGTLTATLTVNYRVDVSGASYDPNEYYTVQTGRALSALTGDMATNPVLVYLGGYNTGHKNLNDLGSFAGSIYLHQDGKYVYKMAGGYETGGAPYGGWAINHAGTAAGSLGTVTLNSTEGSIFFDTNASDKIAPRAPELIAGVTYDDLQAAIDDTVPGIINTNTQKETMDTIRIGGKYAPTECQITMEGIARKICVISEGDRKITSNTSGVNVQSLNGYNYVIQLSKDNVAAGSVALTVTANTNGTASLSKRSAKSGETITVTVLPNNGQTANGVTVKTNTGETVKVTPTDVPNQYTFTVPNGATSISVMPVFKSSSTTPVKNATVSVRDDTNGTAVVSAQQAPAGSSITVTAQPKSGYRTMGVNVTSGSGSVNTFRENANQFSFLIPTNATAVTVTPTFDKDNGTLFTDVWSTSYYSNPVSWAVSKGITDGVDTYTFGANNDCSRGMMVTFLWRAAGKPAPTSTSNPFVDVSPNQYYYNAVLWAVSQGITDGTDATHFSPNKSVSRAEAVTFLYRYAGSPAASATGSFSDVPANQWYAKAVNWAATKSVPITNGITATTFSPSTNCKRCDVVTFLYRHIEEKTA